MVIGAIEAGGTKFVCGIGNERGEILTRISFPTQRPEVTMGKVIEFLRKTKVEAIGIGSFGPINLNRGSPHYGYITTTPKPGWSNYDILGVIKREFDVPCGWDTDVNAAVLGEVTWGAARGVDNCMYYTFGTGVGAGIYAEGKLVHGMMHPEAGHIMVRRHAADRYEGCCPYHGDCLEGMASGPAIENRWGVKCSELPPDHPAWAMQAYYIGQALCGSILMLSPNKIILGGGVMKQLQLFPLIHSEVQRTLNGYVGSEQVLSNITPYIVQPALGDDAGLCGALALGLSAMDVSE
ncbi:ROK family protein [Cohnella candidum]|uniref:fructokinase n=1 Tax=Cohnella candidum TaxID=2674991 RepID=A0A3G3K3P8_9BACL|nr:ROK family protein [Cohnella candidum]AYQ75144.1 ROK family protein [Cohnella candidum]